MVEPSDNDNDDIPTYKTPQDTRQQSYTTGPTPAPIMHASFNAIGTGDKHYLLYQIPHYSGEGRAPTSRLKPSYNPDMFDIHKSYFEANNWVDGDVFQASYDLFYPILRLEDASEEVKPPSTARLISLTGVKNSWSLGVTETWSIFLKGSCAYLTLNTRH